MKIVQYDLTTYSERIVSLDEMTANTCPNKIFWVWVHPKDKKNIHELVVNLQLANDLFVSEQKRVPRIVDSGSSLFVRLPICQIHGVGKEVSYESVVACLSSKFFILISEDNRLRNQLEKNFRISLMHAKTTCFMLFLFFEAIINNISETLFDFEAEVERYEENRLDDQYNQIVDVKKNLTKIKGNIFGIREVLRRILDRKIAVVSTECKKYIENIESHTSVIIYEIDSIVEMIKTILSQIDNDLVVRLNETMRILTAFSLVILPLTLITGIYGMNFQWMPELHWKYGYFAALGLLVVCAIATIFVFKRKKWF